MNRIKMGFVAAAAAALALTACGGTAQEEAPVAATTASEATGTPTPTQDTQEDTASVTEATPKPTEEPAPTTEAAPTTEQPAAAPETDANAVVDAVGKAIGAECSDLEGVEGEAIAYIAECHTADEDILLANTTETGADPSMVQMMIANALQQEGFVEGEDFNTLSIGFDWVIIADTEETVMRIADVIIATDPALQ